MDMIWNGSRIHYSDEGSGKALVFLHGLGGQTQNWIYQRQYFSSRRRVVCLDFPGHGRSDGRQVNFAHYPDVLIALLDHLEIKSADVCGLSKGGRVGIDLAAEHADRVDRLVVINAFSHLRKIDCQERIELYALLTQANGVQRWAQRLVHLMGVEHDAVISRGFHRAARALDPAHIQRLFNELVEYDQRPALSKIRARTLLIRGQRDGFIPEYCMPEMQERLRCCETVTLDDAGHLPYLEKPTMFNQSLEDFLARSSDDCAG